MDVLKAFYFVAALSTPFHAFAASAEPIFHEKHYPPSAARKSPGIIMLHTSGGYRAAESKTKAKPYSDAGYVVYTPDFFGRHGLTTATRFDTWLVHRGAIESELAEIVRLMKADPRVDPKNVFAVGYSNGGYWAVYLASTGTVNAGATHYGVWDFPGNSGDYPVAYFSPSSRPVLALVGRSDDVQTFGRVSEKIRKASAVGGDVAVHVYEAGHRWDCPTCKNYEYDAKVTKDAADRTLSFFKTHRVN